MTLYTTRLLDDQEAQMVKRYRKLPPSSSGMTAADIIEQQWKSR